MNITLIGMAGAGKTTIGKQLAKKLKMNFVDTDRLLEEKHGKKLNEIITEMGSEEFIKLEESVLLDVDFENTVIATGGSAVYGHKGMEHLKSISKVFYLDVPLQKIKLRINNPDSRGIVSEKGQTIDEIFFERLRYYKKYSHVSVKCKGKKLSQITSEIIDSIGTI